MSTNTAAACRRLVSALAQALRAPRSEALRLSGIDGLRALAVLAVMASHYGLEYAPDNLNAHLQVVLNTGWTGVDLFFVISGFLITGILLNAKGSIHYFRNFYARRFLRIFPLFYAVLVIRMVILPLVGDALPPHITQHLPMYWLYASNFVHAASNASDPGDAIDVSWSLSVEEQFYLVWPLIVLLLPSRWIGKFLLSTLVVGVLLRVAAVLWGATAEEVYFATPLRLDGLTIGALLAVAVHDPAWGSRVGRWALPVFGLGMLLLVGLGIKTDGLRRTEFSTETIGFLLIAVVFGALLAVVVSAKPRAAATRALSFAPLRVIGQVSFGLYLLHQLVAELVSHFILDPHKPLGSLGPFTEFAIFVGIAAPLTFLVALLSWNLYESQWLKLKRLFVASAGSTPAPVSASASAARSVAGAPGTAAD